MTLGTRDFIVGLDDADGADGLDRMPPQDVHAEQSVLGGMLLSKDAIADCVETLRPHDFYRPAHETIYDAILNLYGRGEPADAITVADELTKRGDLARVGGQAYLHQLIGGVPTAANAGYYAQIVVERAVLRRLVDAGTRIVQMGYGQGGGDVEDIVNAAQAEVYAVSDTRGTEDYRILGDLLEATADEIEHASGSNGEMVGVPTGFTELDELTNGLHPGQMVVIAARPAVGKSTLALDFARAAAIKHKMATILFSLEMSATEITTRLLSAEGGIQLQNLRRGRLRDEDWERLARVMGEVSEAPLFIDDSPNMALMEIRAKCRRLKQRNNLKLVIIDYLQLMSSGKRVESRQQEVSEFSRALKLLAKELEVPVIALSQLNRSPEQRNDKKPMVSDLRESGCLPASARILRADTGAETSIGELFESGARDVPVWCLDESLRYVERPMTHVFTTGIKPVFKLVLSSGKVVRATDNHPFLTYQGWTSLGSLSTGDRVAVPRHTPGPPVVDGWPESDVEAAAVVCATYAGARVPVDIFALPKVKIRLFLRTLFSMGGGVEVDRTTPATPRPDAPADSNASADEAETAAASPAEAVADHAGASSSVPSAANAASAESPRTGQVFLFASQRATLDAVSRLLLRFGISCVIRGSGRDWMLEIEDPDSQRRYLQEIGIDGAAEDDAAQLLAIVQGEAAAQAGEGAEPDPIAKAAFEQVASAMSAAQVGMSVVAPTLAGSASALAAMAEALNSGDLDLEAINDVEWERVVAVVPDGEEEVYDATVVGFHNFIADGVVVHNSIEQDADMVMLLHRESMYEQDSPREGEADIIVAKHRNGPTRTITVAFQGHYSRFTNMATTY